MFKKRDTVKEDKISVVMAAGVDSKSDDSETDVLVCSRMRSIITSFQMLVFILWLFY